MTPENLNMASEKIKNMSDEEIRNLSKMTGIKKSLINRNEHRSSIFEDGYIINEWNE